MIFDSIPSLFKIYYLETLNMKMIIFLITLFFNHSVSAEMNLEAKTTGIWSISPNAQQNRWLIIHNLTEAQTTGIYHIEVIGRDKKVSI